MLNGRHLINGEWTASKPSFRSLNPATGEKLGLEFCEAGANEVDAAAKAAEAAFEVYSRTSDAERAQFLRLIADEIEKRGADITRIAMEETALPAARLDGERARTTGQLRFFADWIEAGQHLGVRITPALPDRQPAPRPELRLINRPLGPVVVFGASNFPIAFSTAGNDTASALAAGCPVIVRGHPAHPGTAEIVAHAVRAAVERSGLPKGVFAILQGSGHPLGAALVQHPLVKAVGFTGSVKGGRALFDLATGRPEPIPFFGELGSVNPVFLLDAALANRGQAIADGWVQSLTLGVGQFCTNPGLVIARAGAELDAMLVRAGEQLDAVAEQTMLTPGIAAAYRSSVENRRQAGAATLRAGGTAAGGACNALPAIFEIDSSRWLGDASLHHEVFGPAAIVVRCNDAADMKRIAHALEGQLTATIQMDAADREQAGELLPILERKAGRLICNGYPTGVEVAHAMMHGGPYPAGTDVRSSSGGTLAISRFLRPVSYQNFDQELLPPELRDTGKAPRFIG